MTTTLVIIAIAIATRIAGSTLSWRSVHSARTRDAALGLAISRRWWPDWLAGLVCIFLTPAAVIIAWMAIAAIAEGISPTTTQEQFNGRVFPSFIVAGIVMAVGFVYFYFIRPVLKERESQRLNDSTRTYLETERFDDEHH